MVLNWFRWLTAGFLAGVSPAAAQPSPNPNPPELKPNADKSGYTLFNPTPDSALRTFSPDRPTKSNGPTTVDAGRFQYETDLVAYTHSNMGGVSTRTYVALDPTLKLGLTRRMDLELQFNGYANARGSDGTRADGAGDVVVRAKVNLFGNDGGDVAMALIPYVKLPTAAAALGNNQVEGGLFVPISVTLPAGFALTLIPEFDVLKNDGDRNKHLNITGVVNLGYSVTEKLTVFAEFFSAVDATGHAPPAYTADAAVAWLLTSSIQLDAGVNVGLNRNAPNLQVYSGISQRF